MIALLDVNILVTLLWPTQQSHQRIQSWFNRHAADGWATCPFTQAGFVRTVCNPSFSPAAVTVAEAKRVLKDSVMHPGHVFWPADRDYLGATELFTDRIVGHKQVTDAYLLGLAILNKGKLVTMDRGIPNLVPNALQQRGLVTLI